MVKRFFIGLIAFALIVSVAQAQDHTASDQIKTPQEAAQRLCRSGDWLVINKYRQLDPETDGASWLIFLTFRHLDINETPDVWDETLTVGDLHELYWRWADLFMGNEVHFACAPSANLKGFYDKEIGHPEVLEKSYFLVPVRHER